VRKRQGPNRIVRIVVGVVFAGLAMGVAKQADAAKDTLTVDLVNQPSSLDPQKQWNPDSYYVYRNIFDNLVTRDNDGKIVPQVALSWKHLSDTRVEFKLRDESKRLDAYRHVDDYVKQHVPLIPLYQAAIIYGGSKHLEWQPTANESMFINHMSWTD